MSAKRGAMRGPWPFGEGKEEEEESTCAVVPVPPAARGLGEDLFTPQVQSLFHVLQAFQEQSGDGKKELARGRPCALVAHWHDAESF